MGKAEDLIKKIRGDLKELQSLSDSAQGLPSDDKKALQSVTSNFNKFADSMNEEVGAVKAQKMHSGSIPLHSKSDSEKVMI